MFDSPSQLWKEGLGLRRWGEGYQCQGGRNILYCVVYNLLFITLTLTILFHALYRSGNLGLSWKSSTISLQLYNIITSGISFYAKSVLIVHSYLIIFLCRCLLMGFKRFPQFFSCQQRMNQKSKWPATYIGNYSL